MPASPNFWAALSPSELRPSREIGSSERRQVPTRCLGVRGYGEVCLATEDVCTAHTSAPLLPSGSESHPNQCLYDLGASVSSKGWLSPITVTGSLGLIAAQKNQGQPILRPDKAFHQGLYSQHREMSNHSRLARTGTSHFKEINIGKMLLKTKL